MHKFIKGPFCNCKTKYVGLTYFLATKNWLTITFQTLVVLPKVMQEHDYSKHRKQQVYTS